MDGFSCGVEVLFPSPSADFVSRSDCFRFGDDDNLRNNLSFSDAFLLGDFREVLEGDLLGVGGRTDRSPVRAEFDFSCFGFDDVRLSTFFFKPRGDPDDRLGESFGGDFVASAEASLGFVDLRLRGGLGGVVADCPRAGGGGGPPPDVWAASLAAAICARSASFLPEFFRRVPRLTRRVGDADERLAGACGAPLLLFGDADVDRFGGGGGPGIVTALSRPRGPTRTSDSPHTHCDIHITALLLNERCILMSQEPKNMLPRTRNTVW